MSRKFTARRVEDVPETATVRDYDELTDSEQQAIRHLAADEAAAGVLSDHDIVRFGSYYRIERCAGRASD